MSPKVLLNNKEVNIILHRLACQLIEKHTDFSNTVLIGLQPRGIFLAQRIKTLLMEEYNLPSNDTRQRKIISYWFSRRLF